MESLSGGGGGRLAGGDQQWGGGDSRAPLDSLVGPRRAASSCDLRARAHGRPSRWPWSAIPVQRRARVAQEPISQEAPLLILRSPPARRRHSGWLARNLTDGDDRANLSLRPVSRDLEAQQRARARKRAKLAAERRPASQPAPLSGGSNICTGVWAAPFLSRAELHAGPPRAQNKGGFAGGEGRKWSISWALG